MSKVDLGLIARFILNPFTSTGTSSTTFSQLQFCNIVTNTTNATACEVRARCGSEGPGGM